MDLRHLTLGSLSLLFTITAFAGFKVTEPRSCYVSIRYSVSEEVENPTSWSQVATGELRLTENELLTPNQEVSRELKVGKRNYQIIYKALNERSEKEIGFMQLTVYSQLESGPMELVGTANSKLYKNISAVHNTASVWKRLDDRNGIETSDVRTGCSEVLDRTGVKGMIYDAIDAVVPDWEIGS